MSRTFRRLSVVVPMYNEETSIDVFFTTVCPILEDIATAHGMTWDITAVDDGSRDATEQKLRDWAAAEPRIHILILSRNFGKEAALTAGLVHARGDAVIVIDADLQDPPSLMKDMVERWLDGADMVVGVRGNRENDTKGKRFTSEFYYKFYNKISQRPIPINAGDYRLMDKSVTAAVLRLHERNRFMKGIFSWVGFKTEYLYFARPQRRCGTTTWNYWKLFNFGLDGLTSFSTLPLRIWTYIGLGISCFAFCYGVWIIIATLLFGEVVQGYPTIMVTLLFLGGLQMIGLGILGEYIGRLYEEVKRRPLYIIKEKIVRDDRLSTTPRPN